MIHFVKENAILDETPNILVRDNERQILAFERGGFLFVFNFNPSESFSDYEFEVEAGKYVYALNTDNPKFGGQNRIDENVEYFTQYKHKKNLISLYIPSRLAVVLKMN